jgi:hypothetical protein
MRALLVFVDGIGFGRPGPQKARLIASAHAGLQAA